MTNPFFLEEQRKGLDKKTGNPFFDEEFPHAGRDYDSMAWGLGKAVLSGLVSPLTNFAHLGKKAESSLNYEGEFTGLANTLDKLSPNIDPSIGNVPIQYSPGQVTNPQGALDTTELAAGQIGGGLAFKGIGGALEAAAMKLPSSISTRVTTSIAKVAEGITLKARQLGASQELAQGIGNTAMVLPKNVATGMSLDLLTNPDQSGKGIAQNTILTAALSAQEGLLYKQIPLYLYPNAAINPKLLFSMPKGPNSPVPIFLDNIQKKIGGVPEKETNVPSIDDVMFNIVNRNVHFKAFEKDLVKKGVVVNNSNSVTAPSQLANGISGYIRMFNGEFGPFTFDNDLNPVKIPGAKGLKEIAKPLDTPEKVKLMDSLILANSVTDEGALGTERTTFTHNTSKKEATLISTVSGNHHVDYPNQMKTFKDKAAAEADLGSSGYTQTGTLRKPPTPNKVTEGISIQDALQSKSYIEQNHPEIAQAYSELMQHQANLRKFLLSSGLITDRGLQVYDVLMSKHVSFESLMGTSEIVSPFYSIVNNTNSAIAAAIKNLPRARLTNFADYYPNESAEWIKSQRVPDVKQTPIWQDVNKVNENLAKHGMDYVDKQGVLELVTKMGPHVMTPIDNDWSTMYSYRDGYVKKYTVNRDLAKSLEALNPAHFNLFTQLLGLPARALSVGTVENPAFGIVHAIRDSYNATLNSHYGFRLGIDSWKGFLEGIGKGKYKGSMNAERLAAGGGFSTMVDARELLNPNNPSLSVLPKTGTDVIKHPLELLRNMTRPFLEAARIAEYMKAREAGVSAMEAALHSRSFIGDFGMKGASPVIQNLSYMTAFMNPGMQSLDAEIKAMMHHPGGYAAKGMATIGLFTILNYAYNAYMGDDDISKARQTPEGSTYWFTRLPNGKILKTPKPFSPGQIFGTLLETAIDKVRGQNPDGFKMWVNSLKESAEFSIFPTAAVTAINAYTNRDSFSGRPIVPSNLEGIDPQYQQTPSTSNVSKAITSSVRTATLGKVNISPITMDYVLRGTFGTLGQGAEFASGNIGGVKRNPEEIPGISRFFARYPSYATQPIEEFYSHAKEMDEVVRTTNHLYKTNQIDAFTSYINKNANKWALAPIYAETKAQLNEIRTALITIENDPYISGETKKEMRDYILTQTITITDNVNKAVRKMLD